MNAGLTIAYMGGWIDTKEMDRTSIGLTLKRSFAWGTWTWDLRIKLTGWYGIINFIELLLRLANFFCCESLLFSITICSCYEEKKRLCFTVMCKCFRAHHRHICKLGLQITVGRFWKYPGYLAPTWWSSDLLDSINYCLSVHRFSLGCTAISNLFPGVMCRQRQKVEWWGIKPKNAKDCQQPTSRS